MFGIIQQLLWMFNILKKTCPAFISEINSNCKKKIILLIILNGEKESWHYIAVKKLSTLLHGITSKHKGNLYWLNCLYSFRTENKLQTSHEKVWLNKVGSSYDYHFIIKELGNKFEGKFESLGENTERTKLLSLW